MLLLRRIRLAGVLLRMAVPLLRLLRISVAGLRRVRLLRLLCVRVRVSVRAWALRRRIGHAGSPPQTCAIACLTGAGYSSPPTRLQRASIAETTA